MSEPQPTDRELQALKVLWERGEATVRDIWTALAADDAQLAYTTVLSLLQVMEQKRLVRHRAVGKAYIYAAAIDRTRTFRAIADGFLQRVFDGAVDEYLVHALAGRRSSDAELDRLEQLIAAARNERRKNPSRKDS